MRTSWHAHCWRKMLGGTAAVLLTVAALAAPARGDDETDLRAALERGKKANEEGQYTDAAANYEKARALTPKVFGRDSMNMVGIQGLLADCYQHMGEYAKAESF